MKVELLVNLKIANGQIIQAGTIFSDEYGPIPASIMRRVARKTAKIVDSLPSPNTKKEEEVILEKVELTKEPPKSKRPLLKKKKGEDNGKETSVPS